MSKDGSKKTVTVYDENGKKGMVEEWRHNVLYRRYNYEKGVVGNILLNISDTISGTTG